MRKPWLLLFVCAVPAIAAADPAKQAAKELDPFFNLLPTMREEPASRANALATDPQSKDCDAAIAKARKVGLGDDARLYSTYLGSSIDETHYDDKKLAYVTLREAAAICAEWKQLVLIAPAAAAQASTAQEHKTFSTLVEAGDLSSSDMLVAKGKQCLAATDKAIAAGADGARKTKILDKPLSLSEGRKEICQAMIDWAVGFGGKIQAAHAEDRAKRAAPYKAAGISGKKLDLFLEYDDVYWRGGKDCQRISDIKVLAKAKALFHWLENPDGTHTIRKYTFNGNKVSGPISKTYKNSTDAQRGCR